MVQLASHLAEMNVDVGGLLLQTPYTSIFGVGTDIVCGSGGESVETSCQYLGNVVPNLNIFTSYKEITKIRCRISILHGLKDEIIPYKNAERLHRLAQKSKLITLPNATHNNIESNQLHFEVLQQTIYDLMNRIE
jgi:fermentation-respiration switch protein FrsA (DUF1100 family)